MEREMGVDTVPGASAELVIDGMWEVREGDFTFWLGQSGAWPDIERGSTLRDQVYFTDKEVKA